MLFFCKCSHLILMQTKGDFFPHHALSVKPKSSKGQPRISLCSEIVQHDLFTNKNASHSWNTKLRKRGSRLAVKKRREKKVCRRAVVLNISSYQVKKISPRFNLLEKVWLSFDNGLPNLKLNELPHIMEVLNFHIQLRKKVI